jgi:hypothetical protein
MQCSKASGQSHKRLGQVGHEPLAFGHGSHHVQFGQTRVPDFARNQLLGNDSDRLAACAQDRVRHDTHQAGIAPAINQPDIAANQSGSEFPSRPRGTPDGCRRSSRRKREFFSSDVSRFHQVMKPVEKY